MENEKKDVMLTKIEEQRYKFLQSQVECEEIKDMTEAERLIDERLQTMFHFYDKLPESVKNQELKEEYDAMFEGIVDCLQIQLKQLAKSPYLKIEINTNDHIIVSPQIKEILDYFDQSLKIMGGYIQADCDITKMGLQEIKTLISELKEPMHAMEKLQFAQELMELRKQKERRDRMQQQKDISNMRVFES